MFRILILLIVLIGVAANLKGPNTNIDGAIVSAQFRCLGYLCPKWALDVTRYDVIRQVGVQFEYQLIELLPLAPIAQRDSNLWIAYNEATRDYTVAIQDYPAAGMDTFFIVNISDDVTTAKAVHSNIIIGHPDGSNGNPGKMVLARVMYDSNGNHLAVFKDGSVYSLDIPSMTYKMIANMYSANSIVSSGVVTNAHTIRNNVLKSVLYDSSSYISYLVKTDLATGAVTPAVQIQQVKGHLGSENPIAAHETLDPISGNTKFTIIYTGNFDQILTVDDESTGATTPLISDLTNQVEGSPIMFLCTESTKDCDTKWLTSAYDATNNKLYFQTHQMASTDDEMGTTYIYFMQYVENHVTKLVYPIVDPAVTMTFGFNSYQWVRFNGAKTA